MVKRNPKKIYKFSDINFKTYTIDDEMIYRFTESNPKLGIQLLRNYKKCYPSSKRLSSADDLLSENYGNTLNILFNENNNDIVAFCFIQDKGQEMDVYQSQFLRKIGLDPNNMPYIPIKYIHTLCVNPEYRKQGRCGQLIKHTIGEIYDIYKRYYGLKELTFEYKPVIILEVVVATYKKSDKNIKISRETPAIKCYRKSDIKFKFATNLDGKWSKLILRRFTKGFLEKYCKDDAEVPEESDNPSDPLYNYANTMILTENVNGY